MEKLISLLVERLTNSELKCNEKSITQTPRNAISNEVLDLLAEELKAQCSEFDDITAHRIKGGVGLSVHTKKRTIPVKIAVTFPNFENDMEIEEEDYFQNLELASAKKEDKAKAKAEKIKRDTELRVAKAKAKVEKAEQDLKSQVVNNDIELEF